MKKPPLLSNHVRPTSLPSSVMSRTTFSTQFRCSCVILLLFAAFFGKASALLTNSLDDFQEGNHGNLRTATSTIPGSMIDRFLADEPPTCTEECCAEFYACPSDEEDNPFTNTPLAFQIILIVLLISFSAFFSGLTLGLMGLDKTGLEIVMDGDDPVNAEYAKKIYPIRQKGNLLLCTLLLGNVCVNSLLSILTADKFGGAIGLVSSTMLIVIFGEIVPQALCQRHSLYIGSRSVPVVRVVMILLFPVSYPLSLALDYWLGEELATTYSTAELGKLLQIHVQENAMDPDTATAMRGALGYKDKIVQDVMTPLENTFMLSADEQLNFETIARIFKTGYSRIPVYSINKNNVIGLLFVKDLIFIDPEDNTLVSSFVDIFGRGLHVVWPDDSLGDVLRELKSGKSHMALVRDVKNSEDTDPYYEIRGIITLEDIIEEIIGDEIVDETDAFVDGTHSVRVDRAEEFQWAALRLLDSKIVDERLSYEETKAVTAHLSKNFPNIFSLVSEAQLHRLILETPVSVLATAEQEIGKELPDDLLYERGVGTETCTLILSGKLTVVAGQDNFRSDVSSWSLLAGNALTNSQYQPDFTAFVSEACRCLRLTRTRFAAALDATRIERQDSSHVPAGGPSGNIPTPAPPPLPEGAPMNVPPTIKDMTKTDGQNRKVKFLNALQAVTSDETNPRAAKMASVRRMDSSKSLGEESTGKEQPSKPTVEQETTQDTSVNAGAGPNSGGEDETTIVFES